MTQRIDEQHESELSESANYQENAAENNTNIHAQDKFEEEPKEVYNPPNTATLLASSELSSPQHFESASATLHRRDQEAIGSEDQSPVPISDRGIQSEKTAHSHGLRTEQRNYATNKGQQEGSLTTKNYPPSNEILDGSMKNQSHKQRGDSKSQHYQSKHSDSLSSFNKQNYEPSSDQSYSRSFASQDKGSTGYRRDSQTKSGQNMTTSSNRSGQFKTRSPGSTGSNFNRSHSRSIPDPQTVLVRTYLSTSAFFSDRQCLVLWESNHKIKHIEFSDNSKLFSSCYEIDSLIISQRDLILDQFRGDFVCLILRFSRLS